MIDLANFSILWDSSKDFIACCLAGISRADAARALECWPCEVATIRTSTRRTRDKKGD